MTYYQSGKTGRIFSESIVQTLNDIFGVGGTGMIFGTGLLQPIEDPSVVDLLKHSDKINAIVRYHDIHKTSLMDSKRMVERIEEDIEKYSKRAGKK